MPSRPQSNADRIIAAASDPNPTVARKQALAAADELSVPELIDALAEIEGGTDRSK